jgi:hypothetical protein
VVGEREVIFETADGLSRLGFVEYKSQDVPPSVPQELALPGTGLLKARTLQWKRVFPSHGVVAAFK